MFSIAPSLVLGLNTVSFAQDGQDVEAQNLEVATRFIEDIMISGDPEGIEEFYGFPIRVHSPTSNGIGSFSARGWGDIVTERIGPDEVVTLHHLAAGGNVVFAHFTREGTFENPITTPDGKHVMPTGRRVSIRRVMVMRFEDGKIVEVWDYFMNPLLAVDYEKYLPRD